MDGRFMRRAPAANTFPTACYCLGALAIGTSCRLPLAATRCFGEVSVQGCSSRALRGQLAKAEKKNVAEKRLAALNG